MHVIGGGVDLRASPSELQYLGIASSSPSSSQYGGGGGIEGWSAVVTNTGATEKPALVVAICAPADVVTDEDHLLHP